MLAAVKRLRELNLEFNPFSRYGTSLPPDISQFFNCFQHLSQSLQKLSITDRDTTSTYTGFLETQAFHFPQLSYLCLKLEIPPFFPQIKNIIELVQVKPNAPAPKIILNRSKVKSSRSLLELFLGLKKISGRQIELVVDYDVYEEDDRYFKLNYNQVKQASGNLRNMTLHIKFFRPWPKFRWIQELKSLEGLFGNLTIEETEEDLH